MLLVVGRALVADASAVRSIEEGLEGIARLLATNIPGFDPSTEFHAVEMFHGSGSWKGVPVAWIDREDGLGLVLADEHHSAAGARRSLRSFKLESTPGFTKRPLTRIADTVYFGPSDESRMLRATDVATFFLNRSKTIVERDARSAAAVAEVVSLVQQITIKDYVWTPS